MIRSSSELEAEFETYEAVLAACARTRARRTLRRSLSLMPPQMPNFSLFAIANSRQSSRTTHPRQTSLASRVDAPRSEEQLRIDTHAVRATLPGPVKATFEQRLECHVGAPSPNNSQPCSYKMVIIMNPDARRCKGEFEIGRQDGDSKRLPGRGSFSTSRLERRSNPGFASCLAARTAHRGSPQAPRERLRASCRRFSMKSTRT